ncbi:MAG: hypothetical protein AAF533_26855 [Acidobacteriota bacterium]
MFHRKPARRTVRAHLTRELRVGALGALALLVSLTPAAPAWAQGRTDYYNVESPQVHPLELITLQDTKTGEEQDFLLVVNTPDNSLEIYGATQGMAIQGQFEMRIPTGLEPVSVRWSQTLGRFHVANFLGDSITTGQLVWTAADPKDPKSVDELRMFDFKTIEVMDEPLDMTEVDVGAPGTGLPMTVLVVTHMTLDTLGIYDPVTLATVEGDYENLVPGCHPEVDPMCTLPGGAERFRRFVPTATNDVDLDGDIDAMDDINGDGLTPDDVFGDFRIDTFALKQPWTLDTSPDPTCDRLFVLGHLGGSHQSEDTVRGFRYDADLWSQTSKSLLGGPSPFSRRADSRIRGGLGTTNWNMAFDDAGTLYVVGARALNREAGVHGEHAVSLLSTGFVESFLYVIPDPCSPTPTVLSRDLNAMFVSGAEMPVDRSRALVQPTDIIVHESASGEKQVLIAAFGSDRIGRVTLTGANTDDWLVESFDVVPEPSPMAGPRGLALQEGESGQPDRLIILNRVSNSITVFNPNGPTMPHLEWPWDLHDPTPDYVKEGREFLYSARLSGNGFDSCASCHVDGRTDGLAWDLSGGLPGVKGLDCNGNTIIDPVEVGDCNCDGVADVDVTAGETCLNGVDCDGDTVIEVSEVGDCDCDGDVTAMDAGDAFAGASCVPEQLLTVVTTDVGPPNLNNELRFGAPKRYMVTQSLQGLLNHEVAPIGDLTPTDPVTGQPLTTTSQRLVTNAPYHWRGDRNTFQDFNGAFVGLLGRDRILDDDEIAVFEEFINSIHYPPNPKQLKTREFSGKLNPSQTPAGYNDPTQGSGALRGMKLFHIVPANPGVDPACAHCHALPEGSDNTLSLPSGFHEDQPFDTGSTFTPPNAPEDPAVRPMEGAALRGLFQKEARREINGFTPASTTTMSVSPITGFEGLNHAGVRGTTVGGDNPDETINAFVSQFSPSGGGWLAQFLHEFDFGTAPVVGRTFSMTNFTVGTHAADWDLAEDQADIANAGLVVRMGIGDPAFATIHERGWIYDPSSDATDPAGNPRRYREETVFGSGSPSFSRQELETLAGHGPAWMTVTSTPLGSERRVASPTGQPAPTVISLPPPTNLTFEPAVPNSALECVPLFVSGWTPTEQLRPNTSHTIRAYQLGLLFASGGTEIFGFSSLRHVVPRRFRIAGDDLVHGAVLHLLIPSNDTGPAPNTLASPLDPVSGELLPGLEMVHLELPLHPTDERMATAEATPIWETAVELDPLVIFRMMAGRPDWTPASGVPSHIMQGLTDIDFRDVGNPGASTHHVSQTADLTGVFDPHAWNNHYAWVVNGDGQSEKVGGNDGWVQLVLEATDPMNCE